VNLSWGNETDLNKIKRSAENGYVDAQVILGLKHLFGNGVPKDNDEAMKWFRKAAGQGNAEAQFYLDHMENKSLNKTENIRQVTTLNENYHSEIQAIQQKNQSILTSVRTEEHKNFTRIVFEFRDKVQFKDPEITDEGKFSVVFLESSTNLSPFRVYKTDSLQKVRSVEFTESKADLCANVTLTYPYFMLKTFTLSNPYLVLVDAYKLLPLTKDAIHSKSLDEVASYQLLKKSEAKEVEKTQPGFDHDKILSVRHIVYLHYSSENNKELMEKLADFLNNKGFEVAGIERVNYNNRDIRYFHSEDKSSAFLLKHHLAQFITHYSKLKNTDFKIFNLGHKYPNAKKGVLELWITF
jgi:TPR repeat protein